jgi:hypothetical protein
VRMRVKGRGVEARRRGKGRNNSEEVEGEGEDTKEHGSCVSGTTERINVKVLRDKLWAIWLTSLVLSRLSSSKPNP